MQFLEISWDFGILGFSKILGFFQRFFGIFDEVYEDFQSNLPLGLAYLTRLSGQNSEIISTEGSFSSVLGFSSAQIVKLP
jgi:hypothetical protein